MATLRSMPSSTRLSPKLLRTPSSRTIGTPFVSWPALIAVSVVTLTSPGEFENCWDNRMRSNGKPVGRVKLPSRDAQRPA